MNKYKSPGYRRENGNASAIPDVRFFFSNKSLLSIAFILDFIIPIPIIKSKCNDISLSLHLIKSIGIGIRKFKCNDNSIKHHHFSFFRGVCYGE